MTRLVNVGCGPFPLPPPWENYDLYNHAPADSHRANGAPILKDAFQVNYEGASLVYAGHFLEHQTVPEAKRWLRMVATQAPYATLVVTVPAFDRCNNASVPFDLLQAMVSAPDPSKPADPGICHRSWWRTRDLIEALREAGFPNVVEWPDCPWMVSPSDWQVCLRASR